jgi:hypothetical protein
VAGSQLRSEDAELIIGNTSLFAIESSVTKAYERLSFRGLGFFLIHIGGRSYGERSADSTMLACSFDEVERRIAMRGSHNVSFATEPDAGKIADAFRDVVYGDRPKESYFDIPQMQFAEMLHLNRIVWAPDGDEAFDDGSYILQFDILDSVRLIAFKCGQGFFHDPATLSDISLPAEDFYGLLHKWHDAFEAEWGSMQKEAESGSVD